MKAADISIDDLFQECSHEDEELSRLLDEWRRERARAYDAYRDTVAQELDRLRHIRAEAEKWRP